MYLWCPDAPLGDLIWSPGLGPRIRRISCKLFPCVLRGLRKQRCPVTIKGLLRITQLSNLQQEKCLLSGSLYVTCFQNKGCFGHCSLILSVLKIINSIRIPKRDEKNLQTCGVHYTCFQISPMIRKENYIAEDLIS